MTVWLRSAAIPVCSGAPREPSIEEEERQRRCQFKAHGNVRLFLCARHGRTIGPMPDARCPMACRQGPGRARRCVVPEAPSLAVPAVIPTRGPGAGWSSDAGAAARRHGGPAMSTLMACAGFGYQELVRSRLDRGRRHARHPDSAVGEIAFPIITLWLPKTPGLSPPYADLHDDWRLDRVGGLSGPIAQLGERRVRNAEVGSSILLFSTTFQSQLLSVGFVFCGVSPRHADFWPILRVPTLWRWVAISPQTQPVRFRSALCS